MIVVGIVLAVLGWLLGVGILITVGLLVAVAGLILAVVGSSGTTVGGRRHWY